MLWKPAVSQVRASVDDRKSRIFSHYSFRFVPLSATGSVFQPRTAQVGCCTHDYGSCLTGWCVSYDECMSCGNPSVSWLEKGAPPSGSCLARWKNCKGQEDSCCDGLECRQGPGEDRNNFQCLHSMDPPEISGATGAASPTKSPTASPTKIPASSSTITTAPPNIEREPNTLLQTTEARNAWEIFQALDWMTYSNGENPPSYALVASGGAAGDGSYVVSESQSYALLITGTVLSSWDQHAGTVAGSNRQEVIDSFEGYFNFWKQMCKDSKDAQSCQTGGYYCDGAPCLP